MQAIHYDIASELIPLLVALLIGFATGWWIWANRVRVRLSDQIASPAPTLARTTTPAPVARVLQDSVPDGVGLATPEPAPSGAAVVGSDNLLLLKGVGPKLVTLLSALGVTRFEQIAAWTPQDVARVDAQLGAFAGRIVRDGWIDQAALLARGDIAGFEARFGKLDSGTR